MKSNVGLRFALVAVAGFMFLAATPSTSAQNQGGQGRRGGGGAIFQDMTDDQREAFQQIGEATQDIMAQRAEAQQALSEAIFADKVDEAEIKARAAAVAKIDLEYAIARAKAFSKVRSKFTSEQIDAFKRMGNLGGSRGFGAGRRGQRGAQ